MKALLKGKTLTVFFSNGDIVTNTEADKAMYLEVISADDEDTIRKLVISDLSEAEAQVMVKKDGMTSIDYLIEDGLFERDGDAIYRIGIKLSIPELVLDEYIKAYADRDEESVRFQTIDNFWKWLSLCPNAESREDLYKFLNRHGMRITPQGMVLAYRRVVTKHSANTKQITAISNLWVKVRTVWKYNPSLYFLIDRDGEYKAVKESKQKDSDVIIGNLDELYKGLSDLEGDQFTDAHTRSYDYKLGVENRMDRSQGNQSNRQSCSTGFHLANKEYNYSGFGDEAVLCVFNPIDTLAVPRGENGKLRVCAFTILSVLDKEEENTILDSADLSDLVIEHYEEQVEKLEEMLSKNTPYELAINNVLNSYEYMDIDAILERARDSIKGNLIKINE
jgi:hypothetical protein